MTMEKNEFFIYQFPDHIQQRINAGMGCSSSIGRGWLQIILDMCAVPLYHLGLAPTYFIRNKQPNFTL